MQDKQVGPNPRPVHVRLRSEDEDCGEKRSATRPCKGQPFRFIHGHSGASEGKGPNRFKLRRGTGRYLHRASKRDVLECLVSRKDFDGVRRHHWYVDTTGKGAFYATAWIDGVNIHMHKYLCPGWPQVNHENGNGLDNRRENLRG